MNIDRFTDKAKSVLLSFPKGMVSVDVATLLTVLKDVSSASGTVFSIVPELEETFSKAIKAKKVSVNDLAKQAYYQALRANSTHVGTEHLLLALLTLTKSKYADQVYEVLSKSNALPYLDSAFVRIGRTPILDTFGVNLNHKVIREHDLPIVVREDFSSLISILLQKKSPNPLIVGELGVGKRTLVDLLVRNINAMDVPPALMGYRVYEFDFLAFLTSTLNKGNTEQSLEALINELKSLSRVILSIKNFQNIFFATNAGVAVPLIYSAFKSHLEDIGIKFMATLSEQVYTKLAVDNPHILEGFSVLNVVEPSSEEVLAMLRAHAKLFEKYHTVSISEEIIDYVYKQAQEYIKDAKFPQKGLDLLDQACTKFVLKKKIVPDAYKDYLDETIVLTEKLDKSLAKEEYDDAQAFKQALNHVEKAMWRQEKAMFAGHKSKLLIADVDLALEDYGRDNNVGLGQNIDSLSSLASRVRRKIVGQDVAVGAVSRALIRSRLGLRARNRPLGNFLFLGPTGVGKTELAKVLAIEAYGEGSLIRLDMSDFAEKHNVARLVGAPPGYVGYGEGGELTSKIELRPESVVLFDEIEKAHSDVLNILLQIMEEGELVDARGHTFDFSKAMVILTSNLGTEIISNKGIGFDESSLDDTAIEGRLRSNLKKILKPELLNRLDEVIVFKRLNKQSQLEILNLLLTEVIETLKIQGVTLIIRAKAKQLLLRKGYSDEYGARSLRRIIEQELLDKVADILISSSKKRPLKLTVMEHAGNLVINSV